MTLTRLSLSVPPRWENLDHIRAMAAFLVFTWHFMHGVDGGPVPYEGAPMFPLMSFLNEGHVGVSVFMVLSGYIFSKILDGKRLLFLPFIWARILRLAPLLAAVFLIVGVRMIGEGADHVWYVRFILLGFIQPIWPNGGWSVAVEGHFYLLLPLLLFLKARGMSNLATFLLIAVALRLGLYLKYETVQYFSYWTIIGRIDQFVLGIVAFHYRALIKDKHVLAIIILSAFSIFYYYFDKFGGYVQLDGYPSASPLWIFMPTIEGLAISSLIAWYAESFKPSGRISTLIARIGYYSYGIYLLHFFYIFQLSEFIYHRIDTSNFYVSLLFASIFFVLAAIPAWIIFLLIEKPFMRFKVPYHVEAESSQNSGA